MRRVVLAALVLGALLAPASSSAADAPDAPYEVALVVTAGASAGYDTSIEQLDLRDGTRSRFRTVYGTSALRVLRSSSDGTRVVTVTDDDGTVAEVSDASGNRVQGFYLGWDGYDRGASLSPSGRRIALDDVIRSSGSQVTGYEARVVDMLGHVVRRVPLTDISGDTAFLTESLLLVAEPPSLARQDLRRFRVASLDGSATRAVSGLVDTAADDLSDFVLNAAGTRMAYVRTPTSGAAATLEAVPVTVSATQVVFGAAKALMVGVRGAPAFTRDGTRVVAAKAGADSTDLFAVPVAGGASTPYGPATPDGEHDVVVLQKDTTPPGSAALAPLRLNGTSATVTVPVPADPTVSLVELSRTSPGLPPQSFFVVPGQSFDEQGLEVGRTYAFAVTAVDRSGNRGPTTTRSVVALEPPVLSFADPTSLTSSASGFGVRIAAPANPAGTRYSVDQRVLGAPAWTRWITLDTTPARAFGSPATTGVARTSSMPGQTYAFRGQAVDPYGNATVPAASARAVVPFDQQRATYAGSTVTVARTGAYGGTSAFLRTAGASATIRSAGDRLQVLGETCPTCGTFDVFVDGIRRARVDTGRPTRAVRQVLWTSPGQYTNKVRTVVVRAVTPTVVLDAFSARRYAPPPGASLAPGQVLRRGCSLVSLDGRVHLYLTDIGGDLSVRQPSGGKLLTRNAEGSRLVMQRDGNLVLSTAGGKAVYQSRTSGQGPATLVVQNDGNVVLYRDSDGRPLWSSRSGRTY